MGTMEKMGRWNGLVSEDRFFFFAICFKAHTWNLTKLLGKKIRSLLCFSLLDF